jgi:hypothetical protein
LPKHPERWQQMDRIAEKTQIEQHDALGAKRGFVKAVRFV